MAAASPHRQLKKPSLIYLDASKVAVAANLLPLRWDKSPEQVLADSWRQHLRYLKITEDPSAKYTARQVVRRCIRSEPIIIDQLVDEISSSKRRRIVDQQAPKLVGKAHEEAVVEAGLHITTPIDQAVRSAEVDEAQASEQARRASVEAEEKRKLAASLAEKHRLETKAAVQGAASSQVSARKALANLSEKTDRVDALCKALQSEVHKPTVVRSGVDSAVPIHEALRRAEADRARAAEEADRTRVDAEEKRMRVETLRSNHHHLDAVMRTAEESEEYARGAGDRAREAKLRAEALREAQKIDLPMMAQELNQQANVTDGIRSEPDLVREAGFEPAPQKPLYYGFHFLDNVVFKFGGVTDGYRPGTNERLEVKKRRSGLPSELPIYDRVQCEVYMIIFNIEHISLLESHDEKIKIHRIERDEEWFRKTVDGGLARYATMWDRMWSDEIYREEVLRTNPPP